MMTPITTSSFLVTEQLELFSSTINETDCGQNPLTNYLERFKMFASRSCLPLIIFLINISFSNCFLDNRLKKLTRKLHDPLRSEREEYVVEETEAKSDRVVARIHLSEKMGKVSEKSSSLIKNSFRNPSKLFSGLFYGRIGETLAALFLPIGYPQSVPTEYTQFQIWHLIQDSCSFFRGIMSTHAILEGMGVGRADVTAMQANIQWIMRDGASRLGGLLFTFLSSANFGQNVKSWRLFADFINNVGISLEMIAPAFRKQFTLLVCIGSICRAVCGVAAGATGAAISEHWGRKNGNIADVLSKNGAQQTAMSLLALAISTKFAKFANASPTRVFIFYSVLTVLHMFSNYQAMRILRLRSLNHVRIDILLRNFISITHFTEQIRKPYDISGRSKLKPTVPSIIRLRNNNLDDVLSVNSVTDVEPLITPIIPFWKHIRKLSPLSIFFYCYTIVSNWVKRPFSGNKDMMNPQLIESDTSESCLYNIHYSSPFSELLQYFSTEEIKYSLDIYKDLNYIILVKYSAEKSNYKDDAMKARRLRRFHPIKDIYISFKKGVTVQDRVQSYLEAYLIYFYGHINCNSNSNSGNDAKLLAKEDTRLDIRASVQVLFPVFWDALARNDWDLTRIALLPANERLFALESS